MAANLSAGSGEHPLVAISSERWILPDDLGKLKANLAQAREGGTPFDIVVLDSVANHLIRLNSIEPMTRSMTGLAEIAREFQIACS